jgi:deoxyadenosine/deoxycytidine kinase
MMDPRKTKIAIVGPCGAGKTVLADGLQSMGWDARQIAQEHSSVPNMWQVLTQPDVLIYLEASFEVCSERKRISWTPREYEQQLQRLQHAREHSDIKLHTDETTPNEVLREVLLSLERTQRTHD